MGHSNMSVKTVDDAVDYVIEKLGEYTVSTIRVALAVVSSPEEVMSDLRQAVGHQIKRDLGLDDPASADLRQDIWNAMPESDRRIYFDWWDGKHHGRTMHADDASAAVIKALIRRLTN